MRDFVVPKTDTKIQGPVALEYAFQLRARFDPPHASHTPRGDFRYQDITSGEVVGERLKGSVYPDSGGQYDMLRADRNYKLRVPAHVPVKQFWSLTLYSENTRRPYDNGGTKISDVSLDSRMTQLKYNDDGGIDLFIGPKTPAGFETNHMKTVGDDGWFVYFRLYAPEQAFFDKTFKLPDFERID